MPTGFWCVKRCELSLITKALVGLSDQNRHPQVVDIPRYPLE